MKWTKIFDAFPTPKFLDIPFAGLSISDSSVHVIQFDKHKKELSIGKYKKVDIQEGVIVSGQVNNKTEMVKLLSGLRKELNLKYVKISLPEEKAYVFKTHVPKVKLNEVYSAVESKIEDSVPVPPTELNFDYVIENTDEDHLDTVVAAMQNNIVDSYVSLAEEAGLSVLSLEVESQAIADAVILRGDLDTSLIVHFSPKKFGLYVVSAGVVQFASTAIIKDDDLEDQAYISREIKKLYIYWHTLKENAERKDKKINHIFICGDNFDERIVSYISSHNQTPTFLANVWSNVFDVNSNVPPISFADSLHFASAVGLALPQEILI